MPNHNEPVIRAGSLRELAVELAQGEDRREAEQEARYEAARRRRDAIGLRQKLIDWVGLNPESLPEITDTTVEIDGIRFSGHQTNLWVLGPCQRCGGEVYVQLHRPYHARPEVHEDNRKLIGRTIQGKRYHNEPLTHLKGAQCEEVLAGPLPPILDEIAAMLDLWEPRIESVMASPRARSDAQFRHTSLSIRADLYQLRATIGRAGKELEG